MCSHLSGSDSTRLDAGNKKMSGCEKLLEALVLQPITKAWPEIVAPQCELYRRL
jgi:hypothetical protein